LIEDFKDFLQGVFLLKWNSAEKKNRVKDECHLDDIIWLIKATPDII